MHPTTLLRSLAHDADRLKFRGDHSALADRPAFDAWLDPMRRSEWVVDATDPFGGPKAVLAYLSRYTHRVAISNRRLIKADKNGVTFKWKDYRIEGAARYKTMTLSPHEFIRRFLMHVLPKRFHRIRHGACPGLDPGDYWRTATAPPTSPGHASYWACGSVYPIPKKRIIVSPGNPTYRRFPAQAVAGA